MYCFAMLRLSPPFFSLAWWYSVPEGELTGCRDTGTQGLRWVWEEPALGDGAFERLAKQMGVRPADVQDMWRCELGVEGVVGV